MNWFHFVLVAASLQPIQTCHYCKSSTSFEGYSQFLLSFLILIMQSKQIQNFLSTQSILYLYNLVPTLWPLKLISETSRYEKCSKHLLTWRYNRQAPFETVNLVISINKVLLTSLEFRNAVRRCPAVN